MSKMQDAAFILPPTTRNGLDRLAGSGTTEDLNTTAFTQGRMATLVNGEEPIRFVINASATTTGQVALTSTVLGPYARFDWCVEDDSTHVHVEAADASSAYECWTWMSSPGTK